MEQVEHYRGVRRDYLIELFKKEIYRLEAKKETRQICNLERREMVLVLVLVI